jgi:hypothetical protein
MGKLNFLFLIVYLNDIDHIFVFNGMTAAREMRGTDEE